MEERSSYVYILIHKTENMYKIGMSSSLTERVQKLTKVWGEFNFDKSCVIKCPEHEVYNLEQKLHKRLAEYQIQNLENKEGSKEFFSSESLNLLREAIIDLNIKANHWNIIVLSKALELDKLELEKIEEERRLEKKLYLKNVNKNKITQKSGSQHISLKKFPKKWHALIKTIYPGAMSEYIIVAVSEKMKRDGLL